MFDAHANLAVTSIAIAPNPALSGVSLTVATGTGNRFPDAPFNADVWPSGALPDPTNTEIVRVTNRTGDVLTILRAQENSTAQTVQAGYMIAAGVTKKTLTDIEQAIYFNFTQGSASDTWAIAHNLGYYPSVTVIDSLGREIEGDIHYLDVNNITIYFTAAFAGQAFLN